MSVLFTNSSQENPGGFGWLEYKIDFRAHLTDHVTIGFSASTGIVTEHNIITSWSFSSSINSSEDSETQSNLIRHHGHHLSKKGLVGLIVGGFFVMGLLLILAGWSWAYTYEVLLQAAVTCNHKFCGDEEAWTRRIWEVSISGFFGS
nr:L-type lectin-domain containing receptor kinase IX.1-like [Ipomoea batatas]